MNKAELEKTLEKANIRIEGLNSALVLKDSKIKDAVEALAHRDASIQGLQLQLQHQRSVALESLEALVHLIKVNQALSQRKMSLEVK